MRTEAQKKAQAKYMQTLRTFVFRFNKGKDADVIAKLEAQGNKSDYIRGLVVKDIGK